MAESYEAETPNFGKANLWGLYNLFISIIFRIAAVCTNIQSPPSESNLKKLTATSIKEFQYAEYPCKADGKFDENGEEKTTFKILCPGANGESPDFKTDPPIGK